MAQFGMDQKSLDREHYVVSYRVLPKADGQPDFTEAISTLTLIAGNEWATLKAQPCTETQVIGGETVFLMRIFVTAHSLALLKYHDLSHNVLRVLEERTAVQADYDILPMDAQIKKTP